MDPTTTTIDSLPVSALPDRYGVARSQVYNRINALGITTTKRSNKAYVDADQLQLLDAIHTLITEQGNTLEEAAATLQQDSPVRPSRETIGQLTRQDVSPLQDSPVGQSYDTAGHLLYLLSTLQQGAPPNPLERFEQLQAIADHGWQPSTSELADILGLKSLSGQQFERYGFRFTRAGKNGQQSAWRVEKL
ncbi:hypothetical protein [Leptothermofonsia sp. ETS-13]|uniref:hypothetical protein n=1 Tax=Leptothermofonsia sp. ETS-13 TaxID=3035696 RepID=UPI003BA3CF5F